MSAAPGTGRPGAGASHLYAGADIDSAAERSLETAPMSGALAAGARRAAVAALASVDDVLNSDWSGLLPGTCVVTGTERHSGTAMRILFRGRLQGVEFAARHILGNGDFERRSMARDDEPHDVLVVQRPPLFVRGSRPAEPAMHVPLWLRQMSELGATWGETLARLPLSLRKHVMRLLRKHAFVARVQSGEQAMRAFYDELYVPYVRSRFGAHAIVGGKRTFVWRARDAVLLELVLDDVRLGATLLRRVDSTLEVGKMALSLEHTVSGCSDLLDYFSLLLAQLLGCATVDFGVSRPHVDDGVLLYKAKWGARLAPAGGLDKTLRIQPMRASAATLGFLARNGFIERQGASYLVRRLQLAGSPTDARQLDLLAERVGFDAQAAPLEAFLGPA